MNNFDTSRLILGINYNLGSFIMKYGIIFGIKLFMSYIDRSNSCLFLLKDAF